MAKKYDTEALVFKRLFDSLLIGVQDDLYDIVPKLFAKNLISDVDKDSVLSSSNPRGVRADRLITVLLNRISSNPPAFYQILDVFEECPVLHPQAKKLREELEIECESVCNSVQPDPVLLSRRPETPRKRAAQPPSTSFHQVLRWLHECPVRHLLEAKLQDQEPVRSACADHTMLPDPVQLAHPSPPDPAIEQPPCCDWRELPSAPEEVSLTHAVLGREGKEVYVGGFEAKDLVLRYSLESRSWKILPRCSIHFFDIVFFRGKLLTVGGVNSNDDVVGTVYELNEERKVWEINERFPPMPTARSTPTVVARHGVSPAIAACGGLSQLPTDDTRKACDTVEVYSHKVSQWHTVESLPNVRYWMSSVTIQDKCYLMGGRCSDGRGYRGCICVDIGSLMDIVPIGDGASCATSIWKHIEDMPLKWATAAKTGANLVAIGGRGNDGNSSAAVHVLTTNGSWKEVQSAVLPEPFERAAAINLPSGELMIIGGSFYDEEINMNYKKSAYVISTSAINEC